MAVITESHELTAMSWMMMYVETRKAWATEIITLVGPVITVSA